MKKSEIKIELFDTNQDVILVGMRFVVYTIKKLFESDGDDRLNWDLNVSTMVTILNMMSPDDQKKILVMFSDFYTKVEKEQIDEFKSIFLPVYNTVIEEIQPTAIVALIGYFDDEVDDFIYGNNLML